MRLPPVDPTAPRPIRRLLEPLALSEAGRWYVINVAPRIDRSLGQLTGGRVKSVPAVPMLLMTCTGARTGRTRVTPLLYCSACRTVRSRSSSARRSMRRSGAAGRARYASSS